MEGVQSLIHKYFSAFETHVNFINESIVSSKKSCNSIVNQSKILRAVLPDNSFDGTELNKFPNIREKIISNILRSLESELQLLDVIREKIQACNDTLLQKQQMLESYIYDLQRQNSIDVLAFCYASPTCEHIIEWSAAIWRYYHSFYLQVSQAIRTIDFANVDSVNALVNSFQEDPKLQKQILKIRAYKLQDFDFMKS